MQLAVLRRARFGRSSEKLDHAIEQLELLIGELEADAGAVEARDTAGDADAGQPSSGGNANIRSASRCRHTCRARPSPTKLPAPARAAAARCQPHRPGRARGAGIRALQLQGDPPHPPEAELSRLRDDRAAADAQSADRTRPARPRPARAGSGGEVLRPYTAAPPGRHLCPRRRRTRPLDLGRLGWPIGTCWIPWPRPSAATSAPGRCCMPTTPPSRYWCPVQGRPGPAGCGWSCEMNARSDRTSAGRLLSLLAGPQGHPRPGAAGRCRGYLHADGYAGFDSLYRPTTPDGAPPLIEVACWSHVRRKLDDIHHASASPIAREAMERIAALFVIESSVRGQTPDRRLAARVQYARPRLDELEQCSRAP